MSTINNLNEKRIIELEYQLKFLEDKIQFNEKDFTQKLQNELEKEALKFKAKEDLLNQDKLNQELLMKKFQENIESTVKQLKDDSTKITSAIVHDSREKTINQSKEILEKIINPLDQNIKEFREKFLQNEESFKTQIGQMSIYTDKLAKIFRNNVKNQGLWGEEIVEKILQVVGLKEGLDYYREESFDDFSTERQERKRPDFIINLPDKNHIVIDAKVSFTNWEDYVKSKEINQSEQEINENLDKFLKNIEKQILDLSRKEYEKISLKKTENKSVIKYVLMFIPVEGMFAEIINHSNLFDKALEKNIIIVSRASLMPALFLVKEIIDKQKQRENLQEIIKLAENVYERFRLILQNAEDAEISMSKTEKQIQESRKFLDLMRKRICGDTLIKDLKRMTLLGVNGKKLPETYNVIENSEESIIKIVVSEKVEEEVEFKLEDKQNVLL